MRRISLAILVLAVCSGLSIGQTDKAENDVEKQKAERRAKLIDAIEADAAQLRLPENRAVISARVGAAVAKHQPERSASLFRNSIEALLEAQAAAEANKNEFPRHHDLITSQSLRPSILTAIAQVDANYALESFYRTRPTSVQQAMMQTNGKGKIRDSGANPHTAQQEINLEQRLIKMVAEQNPQRLVAILRENIRKHLAAETFAMLKKVWEKDAQAGNELANEVVGRLIAKPFTTGSNSQLDYELIQLTTTVLSDAARERGAEEKYIAYDESQLRSLAEKLITFYRERSQMLGYIPWDQLEPITKRFAPGSFEQLKKLAESMRGFSGHHRASPESAAYSKLMSSNPSADVLITEAGKFSVDTRRSIYQGAANKFSETGQYERALALLDENFEGDALENAVSGLNWYYAHHLMNQRAFEAAEAMMMDFNESNRIAALITLANTIFNQNRGENRPRAMGILRRTRSLLPEQPENGTDFARLFQLINAMAIIETDEAFKNFEPLVGSINELAEAWTVIHRFQGGYIRQGEYQLNNGSNFGLHIDTSLIRMFAQKDHARTMAIINGFSRREMRLLLLLDLLQSGS